MADPAPHIAAALRDLGVDHERLGPLQWGVQLPSQARGEWAVGLRAGERTLTLTAFFMRAPDRHHEAVYARLLSKNLTMYRWCFALDELGDVYLTCRLPQEAVDAAVLDEVLGLAVVYGDEVFEIAVRTGFDIPDDVSLTGPPPAPEN